MGRLARAASTARFALDFAVLRRERPFVLGLAVTDRCNLRCRHCRVWRAHGRHMPWVEVESALRRFYQRGSRVLYLEGGEPLLWRDGERRLDDVIRLAHEVGYLSVHVYTNGTRPVAATADFTWFSADGLHETNRALRGSDLDAVLDGARTCPTRKALVFTVNTANRGDVKPFLELARDALPGVSVMFYLHTPYYGQDELMLDAAARRTVVDTLLECRRIGLPVMNSTAGLRRLRPGCGSGPRGLWWVVDGGGEYRCCRAEGNPGTCDHCGYAACEEILLARDFHPGVVASLLRCY